VLLRLNPANLFRLLLLLFLSAVSSLTGEDRFANLRYADAVVTGRMPSYWVLPWLDGPHLWGRLEIDSVLKGPLAARSVVFFHYRCEECLSDFEPPLHWDPEARDIWYLQQVSASIWTPCFCFPISTRRMTFDERLEQVKSYLALQRQQNAKP
jgi:hypothetical protein